MVEVELSHTNFNLDDAIFNLGGDAEARGERVINQVRTSMSRCQRTYLTAGSALARFPIGVALIMAMQLSNAIKLKLKVRMLPWQHVVVRRGTNTYEMRGRRTESKAVNVEDVEAGRSFVGDTVDYGRPDHVYIDSGCPGGGKSSSYHPGYRLNGSITELRI